jgi:preprotein translocase subunit SecY
MIESLKRLFEIPELKKKIIFTLAVLLICRIGGFIPVPGVNSEVALSVFRHITGGGQNFFQLVDIFSGGAFSKMNVVALSVVPNIQASIIMQLLIALLPNLQREIKENAEVGRRKINRYSRLITLVLALLQAGLFARYAVDMNLSHPGIVATEILSVEAFGLPWLFYLTTMMTMSSGTLILMWLGELISEKGIGNGMSLIISIGILSQLPSAIGLVLQQLNLDSPEAGQMSFSSVVVLMALFVVVTLATILVIQGQRRIPLQYARRMVGRKEVQGGSSYVPLKVNYAGVIPVIFASSFLMFPVTVGQFLGSDSWIGYLASSIRPGSALYICLFVFLIIFFTYFWTATQFRPDQIASDMKKNGAFIPGVRQGKPTQDFLEATMNRITLIGALFLAIIAILPSLIGKVLGVPDTISYFFGGTTLLILVGVVLDTMKQIETHLLMRRYDGFMRRGKVRSR